MKGASARVDFTGMRRAFVHNGRSWYGEAVRLAWSKNVRDEVMFGYYGVDGGTRGEMAMRWRDLNDKAVPRLESWWNSWRALADFGDVIARLAEYDETTMTPEQFCALLVDCGFEDWTEERRGARVCDTAPASSTQPTVRATEGREAGEGEGDDASN